MREDRSTAKVFPRSCSRKDFARTGPAPEKLRSWCRSCRGCRFSLCLAARRRRGVDCRVRLRLARSSGRRIDDRGVAFLFLCRRVYRSFLLLTSRQQSRACQNADVFLHRLKKRILCRGTQVTVSAKAIPIPWESSSSFPLESWP